MERREPWKGVGEGKGRKSGEGGRQRVEKEKRVKGKRG